MPISRVQQGLIVQQEFAKLLMMGSHGRIEVAAPLTDDERRDYEIHVRGQYGFGLAIQVKSTLKLRRLGGGRSRFLRCSFPVRATRLVNNPMYWYFIAHLDPKLMRFTDPVFLIPSTEFHAHAAPKRRGAFWSFALVASMEPKTRDHWHPFRVDTLQLGSRVLEIMRDVRRRGNLAEQSPEILSVPDSVWVKPANRRRAHPQRHSRAA
jgi:hypothetical protein